MYRIIGADGKEYGPVDAEQVQQWIREGRVNPQTRATAEDGEDWKTVGDFPEFVAALGATGAAAGPQIPPVTMGQPGIDIGSCISRAWHLVTQNLLLVVFTTFLVFVILGGIGGVLRFGINLAVGVPWIPHGHFPFLLLLPGVGISALWNLLLGGALVGGLCNFYLKLIRGQPANVGDAFSGFNIYGSLTAAYIVRALLTALGLMLCVVPGVYLGVAWRFTLPLVIDKRLGYWEAMETSRKMVTRCWWSIFALSLLAGLITAAGLLACCIGVLVTAPIGFAALLYAYEDIFGARAATPA